MMTLSMLPIIEMMADIDKDILLAVNSYHCEYCDNLMEMVTGRFVWIPFYISIAVAIFLNFKWKYTLLFIAMALLLLVISDQMCSSLIRPYVCRFRPSNLANPISAYIHVIDNYRGGCYGFPSAHSSNSWGLAFLVMFTFRRWLLSVTLVLWALVVCYSRMYMGVHYLGDLLAGMLLALATAYGVYWLIQYKWPQVFHRFREQIVTPRALYIPVAVCAVEMVCMLLIACICDPSCRF